MSKTWYPIIDYDKCTGCLACYEKCSHGVYELNSRDLPKVMLPEGCVQGCTGCGALCPSEAITYLGEESKAEKGCCCEDDSSGCCGGNDSVCGCGEEKNEKTGYCGCC